MNIEWNFLVLVLDSFDKELFFIWYFFSDGFVVVCCLSEGDSECWIF